MKKVISAILMLCMLSMVANTYVGAENKYLPNSQRFSEILELENMSDISKGVIVRKDGKCADIESADLEEWLNVYWSFSGFDRVVAPDGAYFLDDYYIKMWDKNDREYVVYANSGVIVGCYGGQAISHGITKQNYIWYLPYIGNGRNALYTANTKLFTKYLNDDAYALRAVSEKDGILAYANDLLITDGASEWAIPEIKKSAACNLMVYDLSEKYTDAISRMEFCYLIYKLIATEFSPANDSRMGEWNTVDKVIEERNLRDKFNLVSFSDTQDEKIRFLAAADIINGMGDGTFSPDSSLTREQAATILYRTAKFLGNKTIPEIQNKKYYDDESQIYDWAIENVKHITDMGIMQGTSETEFSPKGTYTVEQAIATMLRLYECY